MLCDLSHERKGEADPFGLLSAFLVPLLSIQGLCHRGLSVPEPLEVQCQAWHTAYGWNRSRGMMDKTLENVVWDLQKSYK